MLTLDQVRTAAAEVVAEQGEDFVYNPEPDRVSCFYVPLPTDVAHFEGYPAPMKTTGCLVGRILDKLGETRHHITIVKVWPGHVGGVSNLAYTYKDMMTPEAKEYLSILQRAQDRGHTWGKALKFGEHWHAADDKDNWRYTHWTALSNADMEVPE